MTRKSQVAELHGILFDLSDEEDVKLYNAAISDVARTYLVCERAAERDNAGV